jgi:hypothetical protein
MQVGAPPDNLFNQLQMAVVVEALSQGYYVSIADNGGMQAAFG